MGPPPRRGTPVILLGTLLFAGFPALFNQALAWTTAARGALALATMPLLHPAPRGDPDAAEPLSGRKLAGVLLALGGVSLALGMPGAAPSGAWRGDLVMLATAACGAVYNVTSQPLLPALPAPGVHHPGHARGHDRPGRCGDLTAGEPARRWRHCRPRPGWSSSTLARRRRRASRILALQFRLSSALHAHSGVAVTVAVNPIVAAGLGVAVLGEPIAATLVVGLVAQP